ncbi:hypothetical protein CRUP_004469, partial [Coryphaenoides rupestris]
YRPNGRDFQSSTLSVPEQVMSSNHCSRSSDINRARSRSPSVPPPSSRNHRHHHRVAPLCREEAVRLLRSTRMARGRSEGGYSEGTYSSDGDGHESWSRWSRDKMNEGTKGGGSHGAADRHEYPVRSRSADQRPSIDRPASSRSRSSERPHHDSSSSSLMRSMPSLPSGRSAPPSPASTRCAPDADALPAFLANHPAESSTTSTASISITTTSTSTSTSTSTTTTTTSTSSTSTSTTTSTSTFTSTTTHILPPCPADEVANYHSSRPQGRIEGVQRKRVQSLVKVCISLCGFGFSLFRSFTDVVVKSGLLRPLKGSWL